MGEESVKQLLKDFGLTDTETELYLFLSKYGAQKGTEIAKRINKDKAQVYHILKSLQAKGLVESTLKAPIRFTPVPFEHIVESTISAKRAETERIESIKKDLLEYWKNLDKGKSEIVPERFTVIQGRKNIHSRFKQMIENSKSQLSIISTLNNLLQADRFGLIETAANQSSKKIVKLRFLTDLPEEKLCAVKKLLKEIPRQLDFEARTPEAGLGSFLRMLIKDDVEVAFFLGNETEKPEEDSDELCLWTNSKTIVNSFLTVFDDKWHNSIEIRKKIAEIETGKPIPKTHIFSSAKKASEEYNKAIRTASKEITILTSSQGLRNIAEQDDLLNDWASKNVNVQILAPITRNNSSSVRKLSRSCKVKHVPVGYLGTTIIDQTYMFQFKNASIINRQGDSRSFEKTFYSSESEYIEKTRRMLNDIWRNAQPPQITLFESSSTSKNNNFDILPENYPSRKIIGYQVVDVKRLTERQILNKVIQGKKFRINDVEKDIDRVYSSAGSAIIHPPKSFNLPDLMLESVHIEGASSFGIGEILTVYQILTLEGKTGYAPVAVLMTNTEAYPGMKLVHAEDPAAQNVHLVKEDELEIRTHGNTMFVGWTVSIPLYPSNFILPPACVLIEGYGEVNPVSYTSISPMTRTTIETNYFNAFVTFLHPHSRYSGPGTDGFFCRDTIITQVFVKKTMKQQK